jgi:hypothetical protein
MKQISIKEELDKSYKESKLFVAWIGGTIIFISILVFLWNITCGCK